MWLWRMARTGFTIRPSFPALCWYSLRPPTKRWAGCVDLGGWQHVQTARACEWSVRSRFAAQRSSLYAPLLLTPFSARSARRSYALQCTWCFCRHNSVS